MAANSLTINGSGVTTISGLIAGTKAAGSTALTVGGTATATLSNAANTFSGNISIDGGKLVYTGTTATTASQLGSVAGTAYKQVLMSNGGTFNVASADYNVNVPSTTNKGAGVIFNIGTGGGTFEVAATRTFTLDDGTGAGTALTNTQLQGTGALTKTGAGTLSLGNAATSNAAFTGQINVNTGILKLGAMTAAGVGLGATSAGTVIASGAALDISNSVSTSAEPLTVSGTGINGNAIYNSNSASGSFAGPITLVGPTTVGAIAAGALTFNGPTNIDANTLTVNAISTGRTFLTGIVSGTGALVVNGSSTGDYVPSGAHTYTGGTTLSAGSFTAISVNSTGTAGSPTNGPFGAGSTPLVLAGGQLRSGNGSPFTAGNTVTLAGDTAFYTVATEKSLTLSGPVTITGGSRTLTSAVGTTVASASVVFDGNIGDGGNNLGLTKAGAGNIIFNGTNTYGGNTAINAGLLSIATTGSLPGWDTSGRYSVASGATLAVQNAVSDADILTMLGTNNFAVGAGLGFDTGAANRMVSLNLADTTQGLLSIHKSGANTLTLSGTNTYTGNTTVTGGSLSIASTASLPGWDTNGRYSISGTSTLVIPNAISDAQVTTILGTTNLASGVTLAFDTTAGDRNYSSAITDSATGTINLTKISPNTLTLSGANTYIGTTTVTAGTLVAAGSSSAAGNIIVGNTTENAVLNVPLGGTLTGGTITVGTIAGANGAVNITGGNLVLATPDASTDSISFGGGEGAYGALTMSQGAITQGRLMFGGIGTSTVTGGTGVGLITGGTFNTNGWFILSRNGPSTGILTVTGGVINHTNASNSLSIGLQGSGRAELNVAGGLIDTTGRNVTFTGGTSGNFHWSGTGLLNLNAGTLVAPAVAYDAHADSANSNSYLNFSGGTLKASNASTSFLPAFTSAGTGVNRVLLHGAFGSFSGGAVIDTNGFNNTIGADLLAPTGNGVTALTIDAAGSGYVGAPAVKILDDGLPSTASAYAVVGTDPLNIGTFGKVTSVVITNPGVILGTPSVSLVGGGGSGAAISVTSTGANTSGGLTKNGLGTLTLTGANTYTGATTVTSGTLNVSGTGSLSATNGLSVAAGAQFAYLPSTPGTLTLGASGTLALGNNSSIATAFGSTIAAPGVATVSGVVNLVLSGAITPATTYTVLTAASGLDGATYNVINPTDYTLTQNVTPTAVQITPTAATALNNAYWIGGLSGNTKTWAASNGTTSSNWTTDGAGTATPLVPGAAANVFFSDASASAGGQIDMVLGADMTINSLTANSSNPVSLLKSGIPMLTIGSTAGSGITVSGGAGTVTLNPDILLGNAQTWTNDSSNSLTLSGAVSNGTNLLTIAGTGSTTFANLRGGSGGLTISSGPTTLTTAFLTAAQTWTSNSALDGLSAGNIDNNGFTLTLSGTGLTTVSGSISGLAGITKSGAGTLTLSGSNTHLGTTTVNGGVLEVTHANALGSTVAGTAQSGTSELRLSGGITTAVEALSINGGGITNLGALRNFSGNNTYSGRVTMAAQSRINSDAGTLTLNAPIAVSSSNFGLVVGGAGNTTISGNIVLGTGGVSKADGVGALTLSGTNTYGGTTSVSAGTLNFNGVHNHSGAGEYVIGNASTATLNVTGGTLSINSTGTGAAPATTPASLGGMRVGNGNGGNGTFNLTGGSVTTGSSGQFLVGFSDATGTSAIGQVTVSGGSLSIGNDGGRVFIGGDNNTAQIGGTGTLTISGSGSVTVGATTISSPNNAFFLGGYRGTGTLNLDGGTFSIARGFGKGTTALATVNFNGGLLQLGGPVAALMGTGYINNVRDGGAEFDTNGNNSTISSPLIHSEIGGDLTTDGGLSKSGLGTLSLSGVNTYNGPTTISGGTLQIGAATTTGSLSLDSDIVSNGTFSVSRSNAAAQGTDFSANPITGTGGFAQSGAGTTTLNAANSFTGPTTMTAGTLLVSTISNIGVASPLGAGNSTSAASNTASLVFNGGTLSYNDVTGSSNRGFTMNAAGTFKFATGNNNTMEFSGNVTGGGQLNLTSETGTIGKQNVLTLTGNNSGFTGNVNLSVGGLKITNSDALGSGTKTITMTNGSNGNPNLRLDGAGGDITLPDTFTYTVSNQTFDGCFVNLAGNNTIDGQINITSGGGGMIATSSGGELTIAANITATQTGRAAFFTGSADGSVTGIISDGSSVGTFFIQKAGAGTWTLEGENIYTGPTRVGEGSLSVSSINSVTGGTPSSNLGAPSTAANGTIALGGGAILVAAPTATGTLRYTGAGESTDRVINLTGTTGGGGIDQSGTGLLEFTSAVTATGAGSKTLTLQGSTAGSGVISGAIVDNSVANTTSVAKTGTGTWTLSGVNTYTGSTTVAAGTLSLATAYLDDSAELNITSATGILNLTHSDTDIVGSLIVDGNPVSNGTYGGIGSGAQFIVSYMSGTGKIQVSAGYAGWATNAGIDGEPASGDFDKDGLTNLMEYALGLNPTLSNGAPGSFTGNTLTFTKGSEAFANGDVTYEIEQSSELAVWAVVVPNAPASPTISYTLPAGEGQKFARLKVTQIP